MLEMKLILWFSIWEKQRKKYFTSSVKFKQFLRKLQFQICRYSHFRVNGAPIKMRYAVKGNLPQKPEFDRAYIRLRETGILNRINTKFQPTGPDCGNNGKDEFKSIQLSHVANAYADFCAS